ncbi:MAG: hypothetical protein LWW93_00525 [Hyphomicrobiales bacterium]|nr:hypothetical protein [Hyphomicrobiales bacterium]
MSGLFAWLFGGGRNRRETRPAVVERSKDETPKDVRRAARTSDLPMFSDAPTDAPPARSDEPASSGAAAAAAAAGGALAVAAGVAHAERIEREAAEDGGHDPAETGEPSLDAPDGADGSAASDGGFGGFGGGFDGGSGDGGGGDGGGGDGGGGGAD